MAKRVWKESASNLVISTNKRKETIIRTKPQTTIIYFGNVFIIEKICIRFRETRILIFPRRHFIEYFKLQIIADRTFREIFILRVYIGNEVIHRRPRPLELPQVENWKLQKCVRIHFFSSHFKLLTYNIYSAAFSRESRLCTVILWIIKFLFFI